MSALAGPDPAATKVITPSNRPRFMKPPTARGYHKRAGQLRSIDPLSRLPLRGGRAPASTLAARGVSAGPSPPPKRHFRVITLLLEEAGLLATMDASTRYSARPRGAR